MEEGIRIHKLSNMMKEKTLLLLLFDFIFKKERTKNHILKVVYMWKVFHAEEVSIQVSALIRNKTEIKRCLCSLKSATKLWHRFKKCAASTPDEGLQLCSRAVTAVPKHFFNKFFLEPEIWDEMVETSSRRSIFQEGLHWTGALFVKAGEESHTCARAPEQTGDQVERVTRKGKGFLQSFYFLKWKSKLPVKHFIPSF